MYKEFVNEKRTPILESQNLVWFVQDKSLSLSERLIVQIPLGKPQGAQTKLARGLAQARLRGTSKMLAFSLASGEVWWRDTLEEVIPLAFDIVGVGLCDGACWDVHNARIAGSIMYTVNGMDG